MITTKEKIRRENISKALKGISKPPRTEEHSLNISKGKTGKQNSIKSRRKTSKTMTGRQSKLLGKSYEEIYGKEKAKVRIEKHKEVVSELWKNKKWVENVNKNRNLIMQTKGYKKKLSIAAIKHIKEVGGPRLGKHEKQLLDEYEMKNNLTIIRQFSVGRFILDGYSKELNIAFEIDESYHFNPDGSLDKYDVVRQQEIEKELGCQFIRIKPEEVEENAQISSDM